MSKEFYEKHGKEFHCATCQELTTCVNRPEPLFSNCCEQFLRDKIADLEAKLAEKDREIKSLRTRAFIDMTNLEMLELRELNRHQDKISFAVEQLEKVKEYFINIKNTRLGVISRAELTQYINNQIEELKKEMK